MTINQEQQIDIKSATITELWKLAYEQQVEATNLLSQLHRVQSNLAALQAEISIREKPESKPSGEGHADHE